MSDFLLDSLIFLPVIVMIAVVLLARYFLVRHVGPQAGRQLFRERLPVMIAVTAAIAAITLALWRFDLPHIGSVSQVVLLAVAIGGWLYIPTHMLLKRRLGRSLVRLPWSKWNTMWVTIGALNVALGAVTAPLQDGVRALPLALFAIGTLMVFFGFQRFELREGGFVGLDSILPWRKVVAYRWDDQQPSVLRLQTTRLSPWRSAYLVVPPDKRGLISEVLNRSVPPR